MLDVIICSHNRPGFLGTTLAVLETQTIKPNVIVVDDSQSGLLASVAYEVISCARVVKFIYTVCDGLYHRVAKFNQGVSESKADYVVLLDDDCIPQSSGFCEAYLDRFAHHEVVRGMFKTDVGPQLTPWFSTANVGFRRSTFLFDIQGFDMAYDGRYGYDDHDLEQKIQRLPNVSVGQGGPLTAVEHLGQPFSGDRVATQINERIYREKWGL